MKKKFQLFLPLLTLPLLTSCPATPYEPFEFAEHYFDYVFPLSEGLDMTINFGLYNRHNHPGRDYFADKYMFLVAYGSEHQLWEKGYDEKWMPLYDITDDVYSCYWILKNNKFLYSKTADIHFDPVFFTPEHDSFTIMLTGVDGYEPDKEFYTASNIRDNLMCEALHYSIDENSNVTLNEYYYWERTYGSSSKSSLSESSIDSLSDTLSSSAIESSSDSLSVSE